MSNKASDILSIDRYLRGELDARAMHLFERATLDDPFLMDALDGYGTRADQLVNLDALRERLQTRIGYTTDEEVKPFNLRLIVLATVSVIGFALVAAWWILVHVPQEKRNALQKLGGPEIKQEIIIAPIDTTKSDTTRRDSIGKKQDSLKKVKTTLPVTMTDTARKNDSRISVQKENAANSAGIPTASAARAANPRGALGGTVHPSTVIADLNKLPYNKNRPKQKETNLAPQISDKPVINEPKADKVVATNPSAEKPLAEKTDNPIATVQSIPATTTQQVIEKNLPKTVIMSPSENSVQSSTTVVQATPPQTVALTATPPKSSPDTSVKNSPKQSFDPKKSNAGVQQSTPTVVNGQSETDMGGRDISSLGSASTPEKNTKVGKTALLKPKTDTPAAQQNTLSVGVNVPAGINKNTQISAARKQLKSNGPPILLDGKVVSLATGRPVAQVVIWNKTGDIQHRLEADGVFNIVAHKGDVLYIGRSGFNTRKIKVTGQKNFDITLEEKNSTLYDGFVQGMNFMPFDDTAHPLIGWDGLKPYQKIKATDGKTGVVKVKFTVNVDNSLTGIKVEDGVSAAADTHAVHVLRDKMKWIHNTNNQPETITVKFKVE